MAAEAKNITEEMDDDALFKALLDEDDDWEDDDEPYGDIVEEQEKKLDKEDDKRMQKQLASLAKRQKKIELDKTKEKYADFVSSANPYEKEFIDLLDPTDSPKVMEEKIKFIRKQAEAVQNKLAEKEEELKGKAESEAARKYGAPIPPAYWRPNAEDEVVKELKGRIYQGDEEAAVEYAKYLLDGMDWTPTS